MTDNTTKSILQSYDANRVKEVMDIIEKMNNEELDMSIAGVGREIIQAYAFGNMTESQRERLGKYKEYRKPKNQENIERWTFDRFAMMESYDERPMLYQVGISLGRLVVASCKTVMIEKKETNKVNGGDKMIVEVYKDRTPKAYEYAKTHYVEYTKM